MNIPADATCFVISPFGEPFDSYFSHIVKRALEECGLYAKRGDSLYRPTTIVDDIWQGIKDAKLLIAELTDRNPNVFYELGLAHAISKPVILIAKSLDDVPFELRSIRVLIYDKDHPDWGNKLRASLVKSVKEVLQSPTSAIPTTFKTAVSTKAPEEPETLMRLEALEIAVQKMADERDFSSTFDDSIAPQPYQSTEESAYTSLRRGQTVLHQKFGKGKVLTTSGKVGEERAEINFDKAGLKTMALRYAKLEVLPG